MAHLHFEDTEAPNAGYYFILFFQPPEIQEIIRRRGPHRNNLVDRLGGVEIWGSIFPARCVFGPPLESGAPDFIWLDMPEIEDECPEYVEAFLNRTAGTINIPDAM